jgi:release factor glutamine methyltransferase
LQPGGWLVLEIGTGQGASVASILTAAGFTDVEVRPDLAGHDRIALARRP